MEDTIKATLRRKRVLEAERNYLLQLHNDPDHIDLEPQIKRLKYLESQLQCINIWLSLLSDDEAFVISRHLIDGIDIPRIAIEYRERWGAEFGKTERTIKTYQRRAIQRIENFETHKERILHNV